MTADILKTGMAFLILYILEMRMTDDKCSNNRRHDTCNEEDNSVDISENRNCIVMLHFKILCSHC